MTADPGIPLGGERPPVPRRLYSPGSSSLDEMDDVMPSTLPKLFSEAP